MVLDLLKDVLSQCSEIERLALAALARVGACHMHRSLSRPRPVLKANSHLINIHVPLI